VRILWELLYTEQVVPSPLTNLTSDLDGDGTKDATPLDAPFLMHGFHPVHPNEVHPDHMHYSPHWVTPLGIPGTAPNRAIGRTDSSYPKGESTIRSPRRSPEEIPGATLDVQVLDNDGDPATTGFVVIEVDYGDGYEETFQVPIPLDGDLMPIPFEPPSMVAALTVEDMIAALAGGCGGSTAQVTLRAEADGVPSTDRLEFDTCGYDLAVAEAPEGGSALSATFQLPKRSSKVTLAVKKKRSGLVASGKLIPGSAGDRMTLKLERRVGGVWKKVVKRRPTLGVVRDRNGDGITESRFRSILKRPSRGACRLSASWQGDANHFRSKKTIRFRC
jgi:hypothetical protein